MSIVTISLIQTKTWWHAPAHNREHFQGFFADVPAASALLLLPEMFSTGFTMQPEQVAETMQGPTTRWLREQATLQGRAIGGSAVVEEAGRYFNRFVLAQGDAEPLTYDKRHCFRMAGEHEHYTAGRARPVWTVQGLRIRPSICYDLRFPIWLRRRNDYDLLVCVANWPAVRLPAWLTLLQARAIENQSFVAGVNILGTDGNGVEYAGGSVVFGPDGGCLIDSENQEGVFSVDLDLKELTQYRQDFPAWQDADGFNVIDAES